MCLESGPRGRIPRALLQIRALDEFGRECKNAAMHFPELERITFDPSVMGGEPCIRGMRVTVGMILGLIASGAERSEILRLYPYLEAEDLSAALAGDGASAAK